MSDTVVTLDVREEIHSGQEPFPVIMQAVSRLEDNHKLLLIVPFEPVPLYGVMANRGFEYAATGRDNGDWEVLFSPVAEPTTVSDEERPACARAPRRIIDVDARGLEPPEPLVKILEAVAQLPRNADLRAHTDRRPVHLYTQLEERGFSSESMEQPDHSFITLIRAKPAAAFA